jgi:hypothetical protein
MQEYEWSPNGKKYMYDSFTHNREAEKKKNKKKEKISV